MALWLTGGRQPPGYAGGGETFLVHAGRGPDAPLPATARWVKATKISFMKNTNLIFPNKVPPCPEASTLLANGNPYIAGVGDALLASLPMLRVLDLSGAARLYGLPAAIGALVHLRYLDISFSRVVSLPAEMGGLVNLRQLNMSGTTYLQHVPPEALAPLSALRSLNMYRSEYAWSLEQSGSAGAGEDGRRREVCLADLESLEQLDDLGLTVRTLGCLDRLLSSRRFTSSMRLLSLLVVDGMTPAKCQAAVGCFRGLQTLQLYSCSALDELHFGGGQMTSLRFLDLKYLPLSRVVVGDVGDGGLRCLERLELVGCHSRRHITWPAGDLPCLKSIKVSFCNGMEELLEASGEDEPATEGGDPDGGGAFPMLRTMDIRMMPLLRSIAPRRLPLGSLEGLDVYDCSALKKLPLAAAGRRRRREAEDDQGRADMVGWIGVGRSEHREPLPAALR